MFCFYFILVDMSCERCFLSIFKYFLATRWVLISLLWRPYNLPLCFIIELDSVYFLLGQEENLLNMFIVPALSLNDRALPKIYRMLNLLFLLSFPNFARFVLVPSRINFMVIKILFIFEFHYRTSPEMSKNLSQRFYSHLKAIYSWGR